MTLYIDSTVRAGSRTRRLADYLVSRLHDGDARIVRLKDMDIKPLDAATLERRTADAESGRRDSPLLELAVEFADAEQIVIAAPFWDLSFPSILKTYIEWINVPGVVFRYSEEGRPVGMCRAKRLYFVSTSGGPVANDAFGFGYVEALAKNFWGIGDVRRIVATGLDIVGTDAEAILREAEREIDAAKV